MSKHGKRYEAAKALIDSDRTYSPEEAVALLKQMPPARFDETILATVALGIDPTKNDQMVRSSVLLPKGLGKTRRVAVFAKGEKAQEAEAAGADVVGLEDLVEKVGEGWTEFDVAIATPDVMGQVAKVAKILGPRGLMPNPKAGTVTFDIADAVREAKAGKVEFRADKGANIHVPIGRKSFAEDDLRENLDALMDALMRAKPSSSKGQYLRRVWLSPAMGPSIQVDPASWR
ncbi:MAG: 50S ribosomal protein L1 [Candidatus Dadabacteria bacterium]|nr:MAG: 50S ribosomal protein L1 [Candidatus Dadabacteria bacterium]